MSNLNTFSTRPIQTEQHWKLLAHIPDSLLFAAWYFLTLNKVCRCHRSKEMEFNKTLAFTILDSVELGLTFTQVLCKQCRSDCSRRTDRPPDSLGEKFYTSLSATVCRCHVPIHTGMSDGRKLSKGHLYREPFLNHHL